MDRAGWAGSFLLRHNLQYYYLWYIFLLFNIIFTFSLWKVTNLQCNVHQGVGRLDRFFSDLWLLPFDHLCETRQQWFNQFNQPIQTSKLILIYAKDRSPWSHHNRNNNHQDQRNNNHHNLHHLGLRTPREIRIPMSSVPCSDCPIENGLVMILWCYRDDVMIRGW